MFLNTLVHPGKSQKAFYVLFNNCCSDFGLRCLSTSCARTARKKGSQYGAVDTERYSSLVKSVVSSRVSAQTPETLQDQDTLLYGPIVEPRRPRDKPRVPRNRVPLRNEDKVGLRDACAPGPVARLMLQRGPDKSATPSVTRVLQQTMSPEQLLLLERWKRRMIAELGEEGFRQYSANLFRLGALFHTALEDALTSPSGPANRFEQQEEEVAGYMESVRSVLDDLSDMRAIESAVHHRALNYVGVVDCVARYRGRLCAIDWKTSEKAKPFIQNTYDNPIQVAAYIGALNSDENYRYQVENGLIVVAYKDGSPAHPHFFGLDKVLQYWENWLLRLEDFTDKNPPVT
ncbi:mitochondrial genome maintenance exonuclease 1-like [Denticeps clupeoides]|uniref:Mitochondrial genome maintenance exonuclease 1 n=1 Tax=Denticeps clupeoides TaxID=299321 RepID=A0AAY4E790_9TELE|nr:mitochondrial genome maintenance exonuclease 1-like [Denticeps clupeoides]